jgi:hypothetical protein
LQTSSVFSTTTMDTGSCPPLLRFSRKSTLVPLGSNLSARTRPSVCSRPTYTVKLLSGCAVIHEGFFPTTIDDSFSNDSCSGSKASVTRESVHDATNTRWTMTRVESKEVMVAGRSNHLIIREPFVDSKHTYRIILLRQHLTEHRQHHPRTIRNNLWSRLMFE